VKNRQELIPTFIRLVASKKSELEYLAEEDHRSLAAQIRFALDQYLAANRHRIKRQKVNSEMDD
jgi:hypothetical protein